MRSKLFFVFVIVALVFFAPGSALSGLAQRQQPDVQTVVDSGQEGSEFLILFTIPQLSPQDAPVGVSPQEVEKVAARIVMRQAEELRPELERFINQGQLSLVGVRTDRNGLVVRVKDPAVLANLAQLPGIQGVFQAEKSAVCSQWSARDLKLALQAGRSAPAAGIALQSQTATDPSINVYHHSGGDWGRIAVKTTPRTFVSMRLLRGGAVVGSGSGLSYTDGSYTFYPSDGGCTSLSDWTLLDGDTVEVSAHGSTVSTVVVPLDAWLNPVTNSLNGVTAPSRMVKLDLYTSNSDPCVDTVNNQTVTSSAAGAFSKGYADFNRRAYAMVWVLDPNGNSTYAEFQAFHIEAGLGWGSFYLTWKSNEAVTATLTRAGDVLDTWNWTLPSGYDYYYFNLPSSTYLQAGDVIALSSAVGSLSYTVTPFSMGVNLAADTISGTSAPNQLVVARVYRSYYAACTTFGCLKTTANGAGAYSFSTALGPGDEVDGYSYDAEGNLQAGPWSITPLLIAELAYNDVGIRWLNSNALTITLKDSANAVKDTRTGITVSSSYSTVWVYFSGAVMVPGDHIEVTDGVTTITMTVQSLSPRLNTGAARLSGSSGNGHLRTSLYDFRYGSASSPYFCQDTNVTNGSFNLAFSGAQIGPQDSASLYLTGPEGYFTYISARAFTVYTILGTPYAYGYSETPGAAVTTKLKRGVATLATISATSDAGGWFNTYLSGQVLKAGDVIEVTTNEGNSANFTLPNLTVNMDSSGNRLYGISPANAPLQLYLLLRSNYHNNYGAGGMTTANGAGSYSFSTAGLLTINCTAVVPGTTCSGAEAVYSFPNKEHVVYVESYNDSPVQADGFEDDNAFANASEYTAAQHHTFHTQDDVDWVKFDVLQSDLDAGAKFVLATYNLGVGMDTLMELYAEDGTTLLMTNDDAGPGNLASRIEWTPTTPGTYYVKVLPLNSEYYTRYCGAMYDLVIQAQLKSIYLPQLTK